MNHQYLKYVSKSALVALVLYPVLTLTGCGGSSSDGGIAFSGLLTQGEPATHSASLSLRHGAGENIEEVEICALGECSTTDSAGLWGFVAGEEFTGGPVVFSIKGHGIDAQKLVVIPEGASDVEIHFEHGADNEIALHHMSVDGERVNESVGYSD